MTTSFSKLLYTFEGTKNMEAVLGTVPVKVTAEMNDKLIAPFSEMEIKEAILRCFRLRHQGRMASQHISSNVIRSSTGRR
jgi:hypothetical protein